MSNFDFVVRLLLLLLCAAHSSLLVPIDLETQLNVSLFASASATASDACCAAQCIAATASARPLSVASPHGWNVTALRVQVRGRLDVRSANNSLALAFNGVQLVAPGAATNATAATHDTVCSACPLQTQTDSAWFAFESAAVVGAFLYDVNGSGEQSNNSVLLSVGDARTNAACVSAIRFRFTFVNLGPYVERLVPGIGPLAGGTDVLVLGVNLREEDMPACSFDGVLVDAHPVAGSLPGQALRCRAPPSADNATTAVDFRVVVGHMRGAADIFPYPASPAVPFLYYESPEVIDMTPRSGAPDASTPVTINGTNFFVGASELACRFGDVVVSAQRVSDSVLHCTAPPLGKHIRTDVAVPLAVSLNGVDFVVAQQFNFTYSAAADELQQLTSQLEAVVVVVLVGASFIIICLGVALYRRRAAALAGSRASAGAAADQERQPWLSGADIGSGDAGGDGRQSDAVVASLEDRRFDPNELHMVRRIGKGSFGEVWLANWRGTSVAVKKLPASFLNDPESVEEFKREGRLLRRLRHPNIVMFLGATSWAQKRDVLLIVEYMRRGSMHELLQATVLPDQPAAPRLSINDANHDNDTEVVPAAAAAAAAAASSSSSSAAAAGAGAVRELAPLPLRLRLSMLCDAARGMLYLHSCRPIVVHRDLKPRNLLVSGDWRVKLCDFGLSTVVSQSRNDGTMTSCGTPAYTAPEILRNFKYCFAASDHQLLTNRGFLFLDELLAAVEVERDAGGAVVGVRDWRGVRFASYDAHRDVLVYEQPLDLAVNAPPSDGSATQLVQFSQCHGDVSLVVTPQHDMYVRGDDGKAFTKRAAASILAEAGAGLRFLGRARGGLRRDDDAMQVDDDDDADDGAVAGKAWQARDAAERDRLVCAILHGGFAPRTQQLADGQWLVEASDEVAFTEPRIESGGLAVERGGEATWCVTMALGFVVVRRAERSKCGGSAARVWQPTIQGNCELADVYSMGIVLWEVYTRQIPYKQMPPFQIVFAVGTQNMRPTMPADMPHEWQRLTEECWDENDKARPTFAEILERLTKLKNAYPADDSHE